MEGADHSHQSIMTLKGCDFGGDLCKCHLLERGKGVVQLLAMEMSCSEKFLHVSWRERMRLETETNGGAGRRERDPEGDRANKLETEAERPVLQSQEIHLRLSSE